MSIRPFCRPVRSRTRRLSRLVSRGFASSLAALALTGALLIGSYTTLAAPPPPQPKVDAAAAAPRPLPAPLAKAKKLLESQRPDDALAILKPYVATQPRPPQLDQAYLLMGAAQKSAKRYGESIAVLTALLSEFPETGVADRAKLLLATDHAALNHPDQALPLLADIRSTTADLSTKREALAMTGTILAQKRDAARAIQAWLEELELAGETRDEPTQRIRALVDQLDRKALAQVRDTYPTSFPGDIALIRLIEYYNGRGEDHLAERQAQLFLSRFPSSSYADKAADILSNLTSKLRSAQTVVLAYLPLTGKLAPFGAEALNGIQLALEKAKETYGQQGLSLIVKDSGSGRAEHLQQVAQAIEDYHPVAVIGPMASKILPAVADLAERSATPLITPASTVSDVRRFGNFIFNSALTYPLQAQRLAEYATGPLGLKRFAILHPDAPYGRELAALFAREVAQRGGEIVATDMFKEGDGDFGQSLKRLKAVDLKKYGVLTPFTTSKGLKRDLYTPGFDAVFVPSRTADITLLAPQLLYHDIKVPLLGVNSWNSAPRQAVADQVTEGSLFVDGFLSDSRDPLVLEFLDRYRKRFQAEPTVFAVQAYDAAAVVLDAVRKGAGSGGALRDYLASTPDLPTLSGPARFDSSGTLARRVFVVGIKQRKLVPLE